MREASTLMLCSAVSQDTLQGWKTRVSGGEAYAPMSLTMTAMRSPWSLRRMCCRSVVLPAPWDRQSVFAQQGIKTYEEARQQGHGQCLVRQHAAIDHAALGNRGRRVRHLSNFKPQYQRKDFGSKSTSNFSQDACKRSKETDSRSPTTRNLSQCHPREHPAVRHKPYVPPIATVLTSQSQL